MDLSRTPGNTHLTVSISAHPAPTLKPCSPSAPDCMQADPAVGCPSTPSSPIKASGNSFEPSTVYKWTSAGSSPGAASCQRGNVKEKKKMPNPSGCNTWQPSQDTPCDADEVFFSASEGKPESGGPIHFAKLLQEEGRYDSWAPFLRGVLPSKGPSLLLGQICFDVTAEDQRGSWLLPEELLTHQQVSGAEEQEERQLFTNTPISEDDQRAVDQVLLQLLDMQQQTETGSTGQQKLETLVGVQPPWLEQLVLRYLHSCSFDQQKTLDLLHSTLAFRTQHLPVMESEVYNELRNGGACYWHGRDRNMRPLLVLSLQRLQQLQREAGMEKVTRIVIFCLEFFLRYLCVAGAVESWCILCDLNGTSLSSFPLPLLLKLIQLIQGAYRGRLYRFYILYAPRLFHFVAKPLVASLPSSTSKKVRVYTQLDDWHQERRVQFAAHQLEKKFGGTAPDITENWYPFRFFPGPFDPEASPDASSGSSGVVRWDSEKALHVKVHPSVHTGASLHTSILRKRTAEQNSPANGVDIPTLRYAAWLHHLPELPLAASTRHWAAELLRCMQGHHERLLQSLSHTQQMGKTVAPDTSVADGGASEVPTVAGTVLSPSISSVGGASRIPSPLVELSTAAPLVGLTGAGPGSIVSVSAPSGQREALSAFVEDPVVMPLPQAFPSSAADETTPAAIREARQVPSFFTTPKSTEITAFQNSETDKVYWESPFSQTTRSTLRLEAEARVSALECSIDPLREAHRRQGTLEGCRESPHSQPENQRLESPVQHDQQHQSGRGLYSSSFISSGNISFRGSGKVSAAHARAYWALEKPIVSSEFSSDSPRMPMSSPAARTSSASYGTGSKNLKKLFLMDGRRQYGGCVGEAGTGLNLHSESNWGEEAGESEQQAAQAFLQQGDQVPLQHPQTLLDRSRGCRTLSLSGEGITEQAIGTPPAASWRNAPACELSADWCASSCQSFSMFQCEPFKGLCDTVRQGCEAPTGSTKKEKHSLGSVVAAAPSANTECRLPQPAACSGRSCTGSSSTGSLTAMAATRIHVQRASQFVSPVTADPSPSIFVYSAAGSSFTGNNLVCGNNSNCQSATIGSTLVCTQLQGSRAEVHYGRTTPLNATVFAETPQRDSKQSERGDAASQAFGVIELRKLRRIVRALRESVSGSYSRSERQLVGEYNSAAGATRSRRYGRYTGKRGQAEQQHHKEKRQLQGRRYVGLRRRLGRRWLSRRFSVTTPTGSAGASKLATKQQYYRRLRLHRRRNGRATRSCVANRGSSLATSDGGDKTFVKSQGMPKTAATLSIVRGTSKRLIRLPLSLSDSVRRGTRVLAKRMRRRSRGNLAI